jgi:membrane protein
LYLGRSKVPSAYGAAGSVIILLVWIYYSAQILLFGAEFTHLCATRRRAEPQLSRDAHEESRIGVAGSTHAESGKLWTV